MKGEWKEPGFGRRYTSSIDGRSLGCIPMPELEPARRAVKFAKHEAAASARVDFDLSISAARVSSIACRH